MDGGDRSTAKVNGSVGRAARVHSEDEGAEINEAGLLTIDYGPSIHGYPKQCHVVLGTVRPTHS